MAPRKDKLKQTIAEDRKRLLLRARKWPYANIMMGTGSAIGGLMGFSIVGGGVPGLVIGILGASAGLILQKPAQQIEQKISMLIYQKASEIDIHEQTDAKDKAGALPNSLLDEFNLRYFGGHPNWKLDKPEYGSLQIYERALIYKNLKNRFRMPMARVNKITLETHTQVRVKKIENVIVPPSKVHKNKALAKIIEFVRKKQRWLVLDYTDDSGSQRLIVLWPQAGNPRFAKQVKDVLDGALRKASKDRATRQGETTGLEGAAPAPVLKPRNPTIAGRLPSSTMVGRLALPEVSKDVLEAAQRASQQSQDSDPSLTLTTILKASAEAKPGPYCKFSLKDPMVVCSLCSAQLHEGCWKANFGCATNDCRGKATKPGAAKPPEKAPPSAEGVKFQVVLQSAGGSEVEREAIAGQMAGIFNVPLEKARIVLQKMPAVARRNLGKDEADTLAERFRSIGAEAKVEEMKS